MLSSLIAFFGGSVFRMIWGEVSAAWNSYQSHKHEMAMMEMQERHNAAQHARNLEAIKVQAELGVQTIRVQGEMDLSKLDAETFQRGVELTATSTGIWLIDAWNGIIRPLLATMCMWLIFRYFWELDWVLNDRGWELCGAVLGVFIADRMLFKRGK